MGSLILVTGNGVTPDNAALAVARLSPAGAQQFYNGVIDYGQDECGITASVVAQDRMLIGTRLRATTIPTDYDPGYLRLLGMPQAPHESVLRRRGVRRVVTQFEFPAMKLFSRSREKVPRADEGNVR